MLTNSAPDGNTATGVADDPSLSMVRMTHFRWLVLALVFFGTTVNYMDRLLLGNVLPVLKKDLHITDIDYGYIQAAFALSYAFGQLASGRLLDWIGTRIGFAVALAGWSVASILHVLARTALGFGIVRVALGIAESPNFPAATKTLAEWFPRRERAIAMGVVNTGPLVGAILAPAAVAILAPRFGWQSVFIITGLLGLVWLVLWLPLYDKPERHKSVSPNELALILSDPPESSEKIRWLTLLTFPQAWAFIIGKFITDPLWWFYMTWFPSYLNTHYKLNITQLGLPLVVVFTIAGFGSLAGGWLSSALLKAGWSTNAARKTAMLICAILVTPLVFTTRISGLWPTVLMLGMATAAHQGFSSNLYTLVSDMFPRRAVGSVAGIGGTGGYVGASLFSWFTGMVVGKWTHQNYTILFVLAGIGYVFAFLIIHFLAPKLTPAVFPDTDEPLPVLAA